MPKKCLVCGKIINKEEETDCIPVKNRLAHPDCFNYAMKTIKSDKDEQLEKQKKRRDTKNKIEGKKSTSVRTPKAELKDGISDEEYKEKRNYYDYLRYLLNTDKLTAKIYAVSDRDKERYGWTWVGMKDTLVYLNEIKETNFTGDIVGLLPFAYEEAQRFYEEVKRVEENNKDININKLYSERIVRIKPPKRKIKQIDIREECN